jgi:hypothetical protein
MCEKLTNNVRMAFIRCDTNRASILIADISRHSCFKQSPNSFHMIVSRCLNEELSRRNFLVLLH